MNCQQEKQNSQEVISDNSDEQSFVQNRLAWVLREQIKPVDPAEQSKASDPQGQGEESEQLNDEEGQEELNQFNHLAPIHEIKKKHNNLKHFMFNVKIGGEQIQQQGSKNDQKDEQKEHDKRQNEQPNIKKEDTAVMKLQHKEQGQEEVKENQSSNQGKKPTKKRSKKSQPQIKIVEQESDQIPGLAKPSKFSDLERDLRKPIEQLQKILPKLQESKLIKKQEMKQTKRVENMFDKKMKEYKHGKKNDQLSNQVFNFIEDYFN